MGDDFFGNIFARGETKEETRAKEQAEKNFQLQQERLELEKKQLEAISGKAKEAGLKNRRDRARRSGQASTTLTKKTTELDKAANLRKKKLGEGA